MMLLLLIVVALAVILPTAAAPFAVPTLFKMLLPSWRFFEEVTPVPALFLRFQGENGSWSDWTVGLNQPRFNWYAPVFNPVGNLYLAERTLLQRIEHEIGELDPEQVEQFENTPSFMLLESLVRWRFHLRGASYSRFQFKVVRMLQGDESCEQEVFILSKEYT